MPGPSPGTLLVVTAAIAGSLFPPQHRKLGLDHSPFSPALQRRIISAATKANSFRLASEHLLELADQEVSAKQIERFTHQIGSERVQERQDEIAIWQKLPLATRDVPLAGVVPPRVAVVETDGGRLQIRPDSDTEPESGDKKHWKEDKIGVLLHMKSQLHDTDPCPEIPKCFVEEDSALKLAQEVGHAAVPEGMVKSDAPAQKESAPTEAQPAAPKGPEVIKRTVIATRQKAERFGPMMGNASYRQGFGQSPRRAFVADGGEWNWTMQQRYFPRFTPILDFVHAMTYVYAAAMAGRKFPEGWPVYVEWINWLWAGRVGKVIEALAARQVEVGEVTKEDEKGSVRRLVSDCLRYLQNHREKMDYASYRKEGLPIMSSLMESTVKQINHRVKGTEKFWSEEGAEAMLQLRADALSDGEVIAGFFERRQEKATGFRSSRRAA